MTRNKYFPTMGMTEEEILDYFLKRAKEKYTNGNFDYSLVTECKSSSDSINIICKKHGVFETNFGRHLSIGTGCGECGKEKCRKSKSITFEKFLERVDKAHPNKNFKVLSKSFNNRIFKDSKVLVRDEFGVCLVDAQLLSKGVPPNIKTALFPSLYNKNRYNKIHNYSNLCFDNTEYTGALKYVTVNCRIHGDFSSKPNWLLSGAGCPKCSIKKQGKRSNTKEFINKAMKRNNTTRDIYDKVKYVNAKEKVLIKCKVHDKYYLITPNDHLTGYGCHECGLLNGGFSRSHYIEIAKDKDNLIYLLYCWDFHEEFFKIGRTYRGVFERFGVGATRKFPYGYEIIYQFYSDAEKVFDTERELLSKYKKFKYTPNIYFEGRTECFSKDLPIEEIISFLKNSQQN